MTPSDLGVNDVKDAGQVKTAQQFLGVKPDGIIGPDTCFAYYKSRKEYIRKAHGLVFDDMKFRFEKTKPRGKIANMVVIHDTISHTAERAFNDLKNSRDENGKKRPLSTNYIIDYDGTIYECNDVLRYHTVHAGALNEESVGIDMVNILDPKYLGRKGRNLYDAEGRVRKADWSASLAKPGHAIDYTQDQKNSLVRLCDFLSDWLRIPRIVPDGMTGYGEKVSGFTESFQGFCAHAQWSTKRWDGLFAVEELTKTGYKKGDLSGKQ